MRRDLAINKLRSELIVQLAAFQNQRCDKRKHTAAERAEQAEDCACIRVEELLKCWRHLLSDEYRG